MTDIVKGMVHVYQNTEEGFDAYEAYAEYRAATHWMHLPPPPAPKGEGG